MWKSIKFNPKAKTHKHAPRNSNLWLALKKPSSNNDLTQIPYVGGSIANDLKSIGITKISDLKGKDPDELYSRICASKGQS